MTGITRIAVLTALLAALAGASVARGASVYTAHTGSNPGAVYQLAVGANGDVSLRSPEYLSSTGYYTNQLGITPDDRNLYATNTESTLLAQFGIGASGLLSPLSPATATVAKQNYPIAISPDGSSLYTAHGTPSDEIEQFTIGSDGKLAAKTPAKVTTGGANDIVLAPDGRYLYVSNFGSPGLIFQFEVMAGGTLKPLTPASVGTGSFPVGMAVTPDGHNLYAGTESASGLLQFTIGTDGKLTAMTPPNVVMPAETNTEHLAVSPDGTNLYASDAFKGGVVQLAIGSGGALSLLNPAKVISGTKTESVAVSPDGHSLYVGLYTGERIQRFSIGAGGALTATANELTQVGIPVDIVVSPDQGPIAALAVSPAVAGKPSGFDAGASSDPDGQIVSYQWSFGDGATETTATSKTAHTYSRGGDYTATVTVTDNEGASTARVFTGHQVLRNGGPAAKAASSFHVASPLAKISDVKFKPKRFAVGSPTAKRKGKGPRRGSHLSFRLDVAGTVAEQIQQRRPGHQHNGKCSVVAKRGKPCVAWKPVKGSVRLAAKQGSNRLVFTGRFKGKKLKPGNYRVVLTPKSEGAGGDAAYAKFTILAG